MATNELEILDAKKEAERTARIKRKLDTQTIPKPHYCDICKRTFKNEHGLSIHNSMIHEGKRFQGTKIDELGQEVARLKNGIKHPLIINKTDKAVLNEIIELTETLNLNKVQLLDLIKLKLKKLEE